MTRKTDSNDLGRLSRLLYKMGSSYLERKQFQEADEKLMHLLDREPDNPGIHLKAANARLGMHDVSNNSIELYEKAVTLNPENQTLVTQLANLFRQHKVDTTFARAIINRNCSSETEMEDSSEPSSKNQNLADEESSHATTEAPPDSFALIKDELENLWWDGSFNDAHSLLAEMKEFISRDIFETATALTETYEHLSKNKKVRTKSIIELIQKSLPSISPDSSLESLRDYLALQAVLPNERKAKAVPTSVVDANEYEFILGMVPVEDFFGELQHPVNGTSQLDNCHDTIYNLISILDIPLIKDKIENATDKEMTGIMIVQLKNAGGKNNNFARLVNLAKTHLAGIPQSNLIQAGSGFVSLAVHPHDQVNYVISLLRSFDQYNAATVESSRVQLFCTLLAEENKTKKNTELNDSILRGTHFMRVAEKQLSSHHNSGGIMFAGDEQCTQKLTEANIVFSSNYQTTIFPGQTLNCTEIRWKSLLENVTEDKPGKLGDLEVRVCLARYDSYSTFLARNKLLGRSVILKALSPAISQTFLNNATKQALLFEKLRIIGRLNHPYITTLFHMGEDDSILYYTRERIEGRLFTEVNYEDPDWEFKFSELVLKTVKALSYIHQQNCTHLNLKPNNLWVTTAQSLKITDFYLEAFTGNTTESGDWKYQAPEILTNNQGDARSDIYSLGILCYEALAQTHPYQLANIDNPQELQGKVLPELQNSEIEFHHKWKELIKNMVATAPGDRCQDTAQVLSELKVLQMDLLTEA